MQVSMWWVQHADYADWACGKHSKMAFVDEDPESLFSEDDNALFIHASQEYKASAAWSTADDDFANQYVKDYEIYSHVNIDLTFLFANSWFNMWNSQPAQRALYYLNPLLA